MSSNLIAESPQPRTALTRSALTVALSILAALAGAISPLFAGPACLVGLVATAWLVLWRRKTVSTSLWIVFSVGLASSLVMLLFFLDPGHL